MNSKNAKPRPLWRATSKIVQYVAHYSCTKSSLEKQVKGMRAHISTLMKKSESDDELIQVLRQHLHNNSTNLSKANSNDSLHELKQLCQQQVRHAHIDETTHLNVILE